jgi:antirestriction protein ArdC
MKRDLYAEVSTRIVAELERGAAPWIKPWSATAGMNTPCNAATNRPYSGSNVVLLWMAANAGYRTPRYLTFKQALDLGGNVRKGEHGTKVYFVKQLQVADRKGEEGKTRIVPMMREYTVFNVDQCEGLPDRVLRHLHPESMLLVEPAREGFLALCGEGADVRLHTPCYQVPATRPRRVDFSVVTRCFSFRGLGPPDGAWHGESPEDDILYEKPPNSRPGDF